MTSPAGLRVGAVLDPIRLGPISAGRVAAFAERAGDDNPIHVDAAAARRAGLAAPPVPGMQIVGWLHAAAASYDGAVEVSGLSTRFLAPVSVGESIVISGRIVQVDADGGRGVLRLMVKTGAGVLASIAEATLVAAGRP